MGAAERHNPFRQWRRDHDAGPYDAFDKFGRLIGVGDLLMMPGQETIWTVQELTPVLTPLPGLPPGVTPVKMTLVAMRKPIIAGGVPTEEFVKFMDVSEVQKPAPAGGDPARDNGQPAGAIPK